jgi:hypothetical protein
MILRCPCGGIVSFIGFRRTPEEIVYIVNKQSKDSASFEAAVLVAQVLPDSHE